MPNRTAVQMPADKFDELAKVVNWYNVMPFAELQGQFTEAIVDAVIGAIEELLPKPVTEMAEAFSDFGGYDFDYMINHMEQQYRISVALLSTDDNVPNKVITLLRA